VIEYVLIANATVAREVTLIIPLGLMLCTLAWVGWSLYRRSRSR
jgi:hypothetical protein